MKFYQTPANAIILHETIPAYCIPKVVRMETGEVIYEKVFMSLRPPPKISLKHDWKRELGSEVAQRPEGQVVQQSRISNRTNQFQTQGVIERRHPLLEPIQRGNPLLELKREPRKMEEKRPVSRRSIHVLLTKELSKPKHVHLMTARVSTLKWHMIERVNPLLKQTQTMCQLVAKHALFMNAQASTLETNHFVSERSNSL